MQVLIKNLLKKKINNFIIKHQIQDTFDMLTIICMYVPENQNPIKGGTLAAMVGVRWE